MWSAIARVSSCFARSFNCSVFLSWILRFVFSVLFRGAHKRLRMSPLAQAKILHPTHSAWSERKGQRLRVQCATSPWEPRLLDRGSPVRCKFERKSLHNASFYFWSIWPPLRCRAFWKPERANKMGKKGFCVEWPISWCLFFIRFVLNEVRVFSFNW